MISFSDYYNAISTDRVASKSKIGKDLWHFDDSFLDKPIFSSTKNSYFLSLKI